MTDHSRNYPEGMQLLVVDDTPGSLKLMTDILSEKGYHVRPASSGRLALRSAMVAPPDLILLDVIMPDMDGYEVCRHLKESEITKSIPIIFISSLEQPADKIRGFQVGAVDFISKPIEADEMLARVDTHLTLKFLQDRLEVQNRKLEEEIIEREQNEDELQQYRNELEKIVHERTMELELQQEALVESEARLQSILHASPVMQFVIDNNHRVISWNMALEIYSGIQAEEILGTDGQWRAFYPKKRPVMADILIDENLDLLSIWYQGKIRKSELVEDGYEITDFFPDMRESGKWLSATAVPIKNVNGEIIGAIETLEDITERKTAEEELKKSERFLNNVIENIPDVIFVKDARNFRYVRFNKAAEDLTGYTRDELYGKNNNDLFPEDDLEFFARMDRDVLSRQEVIDIPEEKIHTRRKGERILHTKKISILDKNGEPLYLMGISEDITDRKRMENALQLARNKLNLLNLITFQEIQNAVFSHTGYLEILKDIVTDDIGKTYLDQEVLINRKLLNSLIFAKNYQDMGIKPPQWHNVNQVFLYAISHLDLFQITRKIDLDGLEIYADILLEKVFFHLMQNMLMQGIHTTEVIMGYKEDPDGLLIILEYGGAGVPVEMKQKIFERDCDKNADLGLFLAKEILSITNIQIKESGEPGKGTRFEILVPGEGYRFT